MNTVTIYKVTCTRGYRMDEQGTGYDLDPWGENDAYFEGYDDGGQEYLLPDGYRAGETVSCLKAIFDAQNRHCELISHHGKPAIISDDGRVIILRKPDEPEEDTVRTKGRKIRLSEEEDARLQANAAEAGLSVSAYIRQQCCR